MRISRLFGTFSHPPFKAVGSWIAIGEPALARIFLKALVQKHLIDCVALASFTQPRTKCAALYVQKPPF
jgi:hypothetical protein